MIASSAALFHIYIRLHFLLLVLLDQKKEHKENRRKKKEKEYYKMWINFKPIYNTLENQTIL